MSNHQGRCSSSSAIVVACTLILVLAQSEITQAKTFTVGDASGWSFNVQSWTKGKKFKAGDALVFNYDPSVHNVAAVDMNGYNSCSASPSSAVYGSGNDEIKLSKGRNYFICSIPGHCDGGLKIAVDAA
ncbi:Chemocyanin [Hibiscus syriacus]|uniref:Basic blue protein n=1 Tax=Hibiscus syriacus TaxID=106335 RepID=A0A6A3B286_HIBSY|nr:basic blue protein-like [Hibiscus syriacus]KAE8709352.1 Chemocyanin [Hibiscus syriacus]